MTTTNGVGGGASGDIQVVLDELVVQVAEPVQGEDNYNKIMAGLLCMIHGATQQNLTAFLESYKSQASAGG
jgi:hypothetical protein